MRSSESESAGLATQWRTLLDHAAVPMALLDLRGHFMHVNDALCRALGHEADSLIRRPLDDFTIAANSGQAPDTSAALCRQGGMTRERLLRRSSADIVRVLQCTSVIHDANGKPGFLLAQFQETTDLPAFSALWRRAFNNAPIGMALLDLNGHWTDINDAWCDLVGYSRQEMVGMRYSDITYAQDQERGAAALADLVSGRATTVSLKKRYRHKNGRPIWVLVRSSVVPGADGRPAYLVSQCEELSERCVSDAQLAHLALHDPLTGLANRALLADRLTQVLTELKRDGGVVAVLVADLDDLKPVNDTHGHAAGDQLLITAADELLNAARPGDTVARVGGDEFAVVSRVSDVQAATEFRDHIARSLATERETPHYRLRVRASVGLATTADPTTRPEELLHDADRDMYRRKNGARGTGTASSANCPSGRCGRTACVEPEARTPKPRISPNSAGNCTGTTHFEPASQHSP
ncbi:sensor domain-containing diguanylate cyclase [Saccharopolyspora phatthalungensis]|uniref:Diguanylate cyclase (GGDEF)-like protein/PAS domain S-box-containing protein n=1 Tax=Saccharopolyspora phatthalungensis TaxID=664693 RepID=A0A840QCQ9_9PSEU|nr:sensor domain-containing diguanylate cyclase [Saccharopolyspora phatthalungensis]MBB5158524.1 diguanylate cyclase (GGDEF)-like protein/PAS domain S-box-containing protein [Saccharopolyspora phatthalungensis]